MIGRRAFISMLGGAAAVWPLAVRAERPSVIGLLSGASADLSTDRLRAFRQGLAESGYVEGRNLAIEYRWADGRNDRLGAMAADLVQRQVSVIVAGGIPAVRAAMTETATIPIVFTIGDDPVRLGLVTSLNRPGANVTGITTLNVQVGPKRLELLHELLPGTTSVAVLLNPTNPNAQNLWKGLDMAAVALGVRLTLLHASTDQEIDTAFGPAAATRALVIGTDPFFNARSRRLAEQALRLGVPAIYQFREFVAAGGLMSYGGNPSDTYRHTGAYAGRILKGDRPADLPVQQATKLELMINLRTAKALGLEVPPMLLARADEVIE